MQTQALNDPDLSLYKNQFSSSSTTKAIIFYASIEMALLDIGGLKILGTLNYYEPFQQDLDLSWQRALI